MINDQITDSVTQIIKYKEGMGEGSPKSITIKYYDDSLYDDMIKQFNDPNDLHIPNVNECKILHSYLGGMIMPKYYMTTESYNDNQVTVSYIKDGLFTQAKRKDKQSVILTLIEYQEKQ